MLSDKQIRMLQILDKQVSNCRRCGLSNNGHCVPTWSSNSKYVIIGQAPSHIDIRKKTFFNGRTGDILINELGGSGFKASQFLMLNSVQCGTNGVNPGIDELDNCVDFVRKYIKVIQPEKVLCLGNYAKYVFTKDTLGVLRRRGKYEEFDLGNNIIVPVFFTINPSYCLYNEEHGLRMLKEDIKLFKDTEFQRYNNWLLSAEDFLV